MADKRPSEMTEEERKLYNAAKSKRARDNRKAGIPARVGKPRPIVRMSSNVLIESGADDRVLGIKSIAMELGIVKEVKNAAAVIPDLDETDFYNQAARAYLEQLREKHNGGKPFDGKVSARKVVRRTPRKKKDAAA